MPNHTLQQYRAVMLACRDIFLKKAHDYGTSWRILRQPSITDQIYIKAQRIRSIEQNGIMKIDEGIEPELMGIINYCLIALIQLELPEEAPLELDQVALAQLYDRQAQITEQLMLDKNHDYGEAWRSMRISTFTDMILMRLMRIKQIEDLAGKTLVSEGVDANFRDMINYACFALIRISEQTAKLS